MLIAPIAVASRHGQIVEVVPIFVDSLEETRVSRKVALKLRFVFGTELFEALPAVNLAIGWKLALSMKPDPEDYGAEDKHKEDSLAVQET